MSKEVREKREAIKRGIEGINNKDFIEVVYSMVKAAKELENKIL